MSDADRDRAVRASIVHDLPTETGNRRGTGVEALPPAARVLAFTVGLAIVALLLELTVVERHPAGQAPLWVPWPLIAAGFCLAELKVVDVHFRREQHSFSLSEFPAVIGLFLLSAHDYLLAVIVGSAVALLWSRQTPLKFAFNLTNFTLGATAALAVFHVLAMPTSTPVITDWMAAFAATLTTTVLAALTIATAISLSGGAPQFQKLPQMIQFGGLVAVANTSLALLAVSILWIDPRLMWLLVVPLLTVFLAYRAYLSEREKGERLEFLYQSGRILQHSPELDSAIVALLEHARLMFRAQRAEVLLHPRAAGEEALRTTTVEREEPRAMVPTPYAPDDPIQRRIRTEPHAFFFSPSTAEAGRASMRQAMVAPLRGESGVIGSLMIANRITEGTAFSDDDLRLLETLANHAAIALENGQLEQSLAELSRLKEELRFQAYHDPLTGLANRSLFLDRLNERIVARHGDLAPVVLFVDLDDFKVVNDTLGHRAGDHLLVAVADRVRNCIRQDDLAARLGGDEFALLLEDGEDLGRSVAVCRRILEALEAPFQVDGREISVSASIGMAAARTSGAQADEMLRNADVAMYIAKAEGKNRYAVFEPTMHAALVERHELSSELSKSVGRGELLVYYQPIVRLADRGLYGVEALVRWRHSTRGLLGPDEFIPLAEESGTILALGRWVLYEACREAAGWRAQRPGALVLSVNLSAAQLQQVDFVDDLALILAETGFPAEDLVLELTETAMFHDTQTTIARLEALRALGIRIAIDDFGTGYSSLGYLRRFQVDILKIAREFIGSADGGSEDWAFARAMVALGRTLNLLVIAEGIEEVEQLEQLRDLGCEFGQGYYFARPSDGASIAAAFLPRAALNEPASGVPARRASRAERPSVKVSSSRVGLGAAAIRPGAD
ncbi:MAG: EAL domain-containing protein [Candidatus Limnocylindrales bacterium]